jgi:hypothetical protein
MEKPIKIVENEKIRTFNDKVRKGLEHALNFMLQLEESKLQISYVEPFLMPISAYLSAYRKQSVMIRLFSDKDFQGELYWFFELKSAIILGCLMRMMPLSSVEEKLMKGDFDATDQDAFGEVGNQLVGILDRAFRALSKKNMHLRMDFNKKVYPHESIQESSFVNKEEYVVLLCSITIPKHGSQKVTLLLPRTLYEIMLNLEIHLEGINPKILLVYTPDEERAERLQSQMNSRYVKVLPVSSPDDILTKLDTSGLVGVGMELKRPNFPLGHQDNILLKRFASNQRLLRLPFYLTWDQATKEEAAQVEKIGLPKVQTQGFEAGFPLWSLSITQDPSKK